MSHRGLWLEGGTTFPDFTSRALAVCFFAAWVLLIAARNVGPSPAPSRSGCTTDPWDFLAIGETVELNSLAFIVEVQRGSRVGCAPNSTRGL
jgi:hypothetical protein